MLRNKKKTSKKKKLAPGGMLQQQGQGQPQGPDMQMQVAGALPGPWGALAKLNVTGGRAIRGDGTSAGRNIAGGLADGPSRYFNALQSGNLKEAIPIVGDIATTKRMINQKNQANVGVESEFLSGALKNAGNSLAKGGRLNKISKDAVEVRANNPNQTDSVEIPQAFVDHNEIIDNQNRVFSDEVFLPNGKSIAKEAKRLEKMKNNSPRFKEANSRIDDKLNRLFEFQESTKVVDNSQKLAKGGQLDPPQKGDYKVLSKAENAKNSDELYDPLLDKAINTRTKTKLGDIAYKTVAGRDFDIGPSLELGRSIPPMTSTLREMQKKVLKVPNSEIKKLLNSSNLLEIMKNKPQSVSFKDMLRYRNHIDSLRKEGYTFKKGGKIGYAGGGNAMTNLNIFTEGPVNDSLQSMYAKAPNFNQGQMAPMKQWDIPLGEVAGGGPMLNQNNKATNSFDWNKGITGLATFAPNAISGLLQRRLKGPRSPLLEMQSSLKRLSAEPQVASATRAYNQAEKTIRNNTSNAADLMSGTGSLLAKRFSNENQIRGQVNQLNAQIGNQEAYLNQGVKARNVERTNAYRNDSVDFANRKLQMTSENVANLSGKILQRGKERNQMERDSQALDYLESAYGDSGVLTRLAKEDPELYSRVKKSLGKSKGGKLPIKLKTKKK